MKAFCENSFMPVISAEDVNLFLLMHCRCTNHLSLSLRLWIFFVRLAVPSKPSSQPIWLKVFTHCKLHAIYAEVMTLVT